MSAYPLDKGQTARLREIADQESLSSADVQEAIKILVRGVVGRAPVVIPKLETALADFVATHEKKPAFLAVKRADWDAYYHELMPWQRFSSGEVANLGLRSLLFDGVPVISGPAKKTELEPMGLGVFLE